MQANPFVALLFITSLAVIVPVIFSRFRRLQLPLVIGEILAGIVIGKSGLDLIEPSEVLDFLAEFGFAYLMFLAGFELDFSMIANFSWGKSFRQTVNQPIPIALGLFTLTVLLALIGSLLLQQIGDIHNPLLMALILSTTSLGIVAPVLKQRGLLATEYGQFLLVAASIADFATLILLTVVIAIQGQGLTLDLLLVPALLLIFILVAQVGQRISRWEWPQRVVEELSHATTQIKVRGTFALMVAWVVLADTFGVELILGAFLAGAIANLISKPDSEELHEKLDTIGYGFFIPVFFFMIGVELELSTVTQSSRALLLVPELVIIAYLVKLGPILLIRNQFGFRNTLAGGALLSSRLSLIIAASEIAREIGAITVAVETAIVLVAVITCVFSPLMFNRLVRLEDTIQRRGIIIVGIVQLTELLVRRLRDSYSRITVVSPDHADTSRLEGVDLIHGDGSEEQTLEKAGAADAQALIVLVDNPDQTWQICSLARQSYGVPIVISQVNDAELTSRLRKLGVRVVQPALATAMALEGALRYPTIFDVLQQEVSDTELLEVTIMNDRWAEIPLRRVRLPGNALILSIKRDGTMLIPHGDTTLRLDDRVTLIGHPDAISEATGMFFQ